MQKMYQDALTIRKNFSAFRYGDLIWAHAQDSKWVLAFLRKDPVNGQTLLVAANFGDMDWTHNHSYGVQTGGIFGQWMQIFCSQDAAYGGWHGAGNAFYIPWTQADGKVYLNMPKYSVIVMQLT